MIQSFVKSVALALALGGAVASAALAADPVPIKFTLDWAKEGPNSFVMLADERGFFKDPAIKSITFDRGFGSGKVPVDIAAGTYQMGMADINPTIKFLAENPNSGLIAIAILADGAPLAAFSKKDGPVQKPKDLEGKKIAAPDFDAGRQLFPAFAAATGIDMSTIQWISVKPELREPMLVQGQADAITGFLTSSLLSLKRIGVKESDLNIFMYKDYGLPFYSTALITTKKFAEAHPEAVKAVVAGMIKGLKAQIAEPEAAMAALKKAEPLTDTAIERERMQLWFDTLVLTPHVKENGLSQVDPARMQAAIVAVENAYKMPNKLTVDALYTDAYLPPKADLQVK